MNIFSNIGITELVVILLLALLVVGPERLPEMSRKLAKTLRDVRKAYENITKDLGPELMSLQETTREIRDSVDSVRSIPQDMVDSVIKAADLEDTVKDLKEVQESIQQVSKSVNQAGQIVKHPLGQVVESARGALQPSVPDNKTGELLADEAATTAMATSRQETQSQAAPSGKEGKEEADD